MPAMPPLADANVRSPTYYVLRAHALCRRCGQSTALLALGVPLDHETLDLPDDTQEDTERADAPERAGTWQRAGANAFLFFVQELPDGVRRRLNGLSQCFRPAYSAATLNSYWANHCEHCSAPFGDHELHCEPEGAFMPAGEEAAAGVQLLPIREPFEAIAAGYSLEPEFFSCMRRS